MAARGGYEYQFIASPPDWLICNICRYPSRQPYLSDCCGNTFCKSCLEHGKKDATVDSCPICLKTLLDGTPCKQADQTIRSLHVFCTNKEKGFEWQGEVKDIDDHLGSRDGCQFEEEICSVGCGKQLQRQYLTSHNKNDCVRRKVNCQHCHIAGEHQFIEGEHEKLCPKFLTVCPKKTSKNFASNDNIPTIIDNLLTSQEEARKTINKLTQELTFTKQQLATTSQNLTKAENKHITLAAYTDKALANLEVKFQSKRLIVLLKRGLLN